MIGSHIKKNKTTPLFDIGTTDSRRRWNWKVGRGKAKGIFGVKCWKGRNLEDSGKDVAG